MHSKECKKATCEGVGKVRGSGAEESKTPGLAMAGEGASPSSGVERPMKREVTRTLKDSC